MAIKTIEFPVFIGGQSDYHNFSTIIQVLADLGVRGVKYTEVDYNEGYAAVLYVKKDKEYHYMINQYTNTEEDDGE